MKLFLWLFQIVAEMVRNLVMALLLTYTVSRSWLGIFHMVGVVSYNIFAMIVACKKEDGRETIVDQRNVDIGKAADAVVQTEYVYEELSTKIQSVSLLKFRERAVFPKCETSEGLCAKARDFKLMCSIDYNNYLEGPRCRLFACSRGCKRMTERRKLRCGEPSGICSRLKIAMQKVER